jgi:hypothetical protein
MFFPNLCAKHFTRVIYDRKKINFVGGPHTAWKHAQGPVTVPKMSLIFLQGTLKGEVSLYC